jgi:hypothetical protein
VRILQRTVALLGSLVALAFPILAVDFTGTYKGDLTGTGSKTATTIVFKSKGNDLTGTLKNPSGVYPIENGSVDGQDCFFNVTIKVDGEDFRLTYRGHIFADEIQFRVEAGERTLDLVAKKVSQSRIDP